MTSAERIYQITKKIPKGKVLTYQKLANLAKIKSPRIVGTFLHQNPDPQKIPCHRVVNSQGRLAKHFAFGGITGQAQRLRSEGIAVKNSQVDLEKYLWVVK